MNKPSRNKQTDASLSNIRFSRKRQGIAGIVWRRIAVSIPLLIVTTLAVFALAAFSPYDPLEAYLGGQEGNLDDTQRESISRELGLDRPWWLAWIIWWREIFSGNLGTSRAYSQPVADVLIDRLPWTILLGACGLAGAILLALVLGVWAAMHRGSIADRLIAAVGTVVQATPPFVIAIGGLGIFALTWKLFPLGGLTYPGESVTFSSTIEHLALPSMVLAITQAPWLILSLRQSLIEVMDSPAIVGARVRGIRRSTIIFRHIIPTAAPPFLALIGARLSELIVGSTLVEEIFGWPGLGTALVKSAQSLDYPLLSVLTIATMFVVLFGNLLADISYVLLDPRVEADA